MTTLRQLIAEACPDLADRLPAADRMIRGLECDSRKIEKDFIFVAIRGAKQDGGLFIREAVSRGAVAVVAEPTAASERPSDVVFLAVPEARAAMASLSAAFYGHPARALQCVGVTGTNGKTTCSYLIEHLLARAGRSAGVIGTVNYRFGGKQIPATETTPGPLRIQQILAEMVAGGCRYAVMEVSSHALDQNRTGGIDFGVALFTNLTQDHLDYHGTLENYFSSKAKLFTGLSAESHAVINADDPWGRRLLSMTPARVISYGIRQEAVFRAKDIRPAPGGMTRFALEVGGERSEVRLPMIGMHNVYNALGALASTLALGLDWKRSAEDLADFSGVPGRLERIDAGQDFSVVVDFAHSPDGLENVLKSLEPYKEEGKMILVFGCGGDRDRGKRPKMAEVASRYCDSVIVTSDNPRSEDPRAIIDEVKAGFPAGFKRYSTVTDRRKAIRQALLSAKRGDIVLLAGKGHERTQIIGSDVLPFSDREEAERVLLGH